MTRAFALFLVTALAVGCGEPADEIVIVPDSYVSVIGLDGQKSTIPSAELYDHGTGQPTVDSVLAIDRVTNQQVYVKMDQLSSESPVNARYLLMTQDPPAAPPQANERH